MSVTAKQLPLFDATGQPALKRHTPAHRKAAKGGKALVEQVSLELKEKRFLPVVTVPRTRAECPPRSEREKDGCCKHVRCEWNLAREDAEDRAGRPGLAHVPRGHRGWTLSVEGDVGDERAETTLRPIWLGYGWSAKAEIERDDEGRIVDVQFVDGVNGPQLGRWEAMDVEVDEPLEVWHDGVLVAMARLTGEGAIAFDRPVQNAMTVEIKRPGHAPSCGLDVIGQGGPKTTKEVGLAIGRSASLVRKIVRRALLRLRNSGVSAEQISALLNWDPDSDKP